MSAALVWSRLGCALALVGLAACATPDATPYLQYAQLKAMREGRPRVETPGVQRRALADGAMTREVLLLPDGGALRHGTERESYSGGARRAERHFERDVPVGEWTQWYEDGTVRSHYVHGEGPTPMTFYAPDGAITATGPALLGVRVGEWRFYHRGGVLAKEGAYVDGKREGEWRLYDEEGALIGRLWYHADQRVASESPTSQLNSL
ncbi:MAG: hypothetical protein R3F49_03995 [Planctomycetota bacterium]